MENEETLSQTYAGAQCHEPRISGLAVGSLVFGALGPFSSGVMWILTLNDLSTQRSPFMMVVFSCAVSWILGLALGAKSLVQIETSERQIAGREYAIVGMILSTVWMLVVFMSFFMPALYSVNS